MLKVKHLKVINQLKLTTMTLVKNRKEALSKYDSEKVYSLEDASKIVKDVTKVKFDPSVDIAIRLGIDPRKSNQMVRGTVSLPHGTGKDVKVLVLCTPVRCENFLFPLENSCFSTSNIKRSIKFVTPV